jgi:hypothetical protein
MDSGARNALTENRKTPFFSQTTGGPICSTRSTLSTPDGDVFRKPRTGLRGGLMEPQQHFGEVAETLPMGRV